MIDNEEDVLAAAKQILKANIEIRRCTYDGSLSDFLLRECEYNSLVWERDRIIQEIKDYDAKANPARKGGWFFTAGGHRFWREDPRPEDVFIEDIAHALSMLCRFCGHTSSFYSVAPKLKPSP